MPNQKQQGVHQQEKQEKQEQQNQLSSQAALQTNSQVGAGATALGGSYNMEFGNEPADGQEVTKQNQHADAKKQQSVRK